MTSLLVLENSVWQIGPGSADIRMWSPALYDRGVSLRRYLLILQSFPDTQIYLDTYGTFVLT
jgi:hypothetical protein